MLQLLERAGVPNADGLHELFLSEEMDVESLELCDEGDFLEIGVGREDAAKICAFFRRANGAHQSQ